MRFTTFPAASAALTRVCKWLSWVVCCFTKHVAMLSRLFRTTLVDILLFWRIFFVVLLLVNDKPGSETRQKHMIHV